MKKMLLLAVCIPALLASCELFGDFGKKVEVNEKNQVYYKGDGVTEADAKKLGSYFESIGVFDGKEEKSVQITKDGDAYVVRLVIKEDVVKKNQQQYETIFWYWQDMISENVFAGKKTKIILTDDKFKDLITLEEMNKVKVGADHFVYFKGQGIKENEAKEIGEKFEKELIFPYTDGSVLVTKELGTMFVRFVPNAEHVQADKETYYNTIANLQYLISKYVLDEQVKLVVTDADCNDVKKFDELSAEQKTVLDQRMTGTVPQAEPNQFTRQTEPEEVVEY